MAMAIEAQHQVVGNQTGNYPGILGKQFVYEESVLDRLNSSKGYAK